MVGKWRERLKSIKEEQKQAENARKAAKSALEAQQALEEQLGILLPPPVTPRPPPPPPPPPVHQPPWPKRPSIWDSSGFQDSAGRPMRWDHLSINETRRLTRDPITQPPWTEAVARDLPNFANLRVLYEDDPVVLELVDLLEDLLA